MKFHRDGYVLRPGGAAYTRTFEFAVPHGKRGVRVDYRETLVRSARTGRLLRVERPVRQLYKVVRVAGVACDDCGKVYLRTPRSCKCGCEMFKTRSRLALA